MEKRTFVFAAGLRTKEDCTLVSAADLYGEEKGYGFVTEQNFEEQELLRLPECGSGFEPAPWFRGSSLTVMEQKKMGCSVRQDEWPQAGRSIPLRFRCRADHRKRYRLLIELCPDQTMKELRIFVQRRQQVFYQEVCSAGKRVVCEAYVHPGSIIPRGQTGHQACASLDVTVTADCPCISRIVIEEADVPVLFIGGDSTVTDQPAEYPYAPADSYAGWGQMLPCWLGAGLPVSNHAHSGLTTESFREEGHEALMQESMRAGDYLLLQFGHNDQKLDHLKAGEGYRDRLSEYIREYRKRGICVLLVTPVARNSWRTQDHYSDLLKPYADACLALGEAQGVPVLDLHRCSMEFLLKKGRDAAKAWFYPSDYTHHNDFGAYLMAGFISREIDRTCSGHEQKAYWQLARFLRKQPVQMGEPKAAAALERPAEYAVPSVVQTMAAELSRPEELLLRAEAMDMVIRCAGFFKTNVYNDFFEDVVGHEWYAGAVECALQNGILTPETVSGRHCDPESPVTLAHFCVFAMNGYISRKAAPPANPGPYDVQQTGPVRDSLRMAYSLGLLAADGSDRTDGFLTRRQGAMLLQKLRIL